MSKLAFVLAVLLAPAIFVAGAIATPAMAQEKKSENKMDKAKAGQVTLKQLQENDKLRIYEATFKPGDVSPNAKRPMRTVYAIRGGTLERTFEDGTKEKLLWKAGQGRVISEERPYSVKNIGKTTVRLVVTAVK